MSAAVDAPPLDPNEVRNAEASGTAAIVSIVPDRRFAQLWHDEFEDCDFLSRGMGASHGKVKRCLNNRFAPGSPRVCW